MKFLVSHSQSEQHVITREETKNVVGIKSWVIQLWVTTTGDIYVPTGRWGHTDLFLITSDVNRLAEIVKQIVEVRVETSENKDQANHYYLDLLQSDEERADMETKMVLAITARIDMMNREGIKGIDTDPVGVISRKTLEAVDEMERGS
ncbi:expressed protein [Phakopsora pachyrhizi]|uniref:Expressed protein n=1 Tax=Phakopsora pachyrhizi TaxID=170000 RepID=A0AAV0BM89_PHAPC|nr:expressed protein [Phakopsora pachyrhizi]